MPTNVDSTNLNKSLACINFIKSSLKIDSFSDGSQDIDLVSQEIMVTDTRFASVRPCSSRTDDEKQTNVFTNILQPINFKPDTDSVQAEVHSRRRKDSSKYTILLNSMRLMAILDWLESVRDFLSQNAELPKDPLLIHRVNEMQENLVSPSSAPGIDETIELILNITDSELVFVERPNQWDTNAVILKSTTVVSYRPIEINKVMSINLNHLEVFSCILGNEEETALSIIDPVTVNLDLKRNVLDIQLQKRLCVRLSYHDLKMFIQMMESLPKQTKNATKTREMAALDLQTPGNDLLVSKLNALGFSTHDCRKALEACNNQLDEAALWLTQNAEPSKSNQSLAINLLDIHAIELRANCISICVIDDCKDADVPLLELSLVDLEVNQATTELRRGSIGSGGSVFKAGSLRGTFSSDYYNRGLSGWEPLIEPWKCSAAWSYSLGSGIQRNRLHLKVNSDNRLIVNVTSTIIELYQLVHNNWSQDYYGSGTMDTLSPTNIKNYRQRSPFVPFAIKNETGERLWFSTKVASEGEAGGYSSAGSGTSIANQNDQWSCVDAGETKTFSFGPQTKQRHLDSHKLNFHQICVRVEGWNEVGPISVDKVGVFFRHARHSSDEFLAMPRTRIVFAVSLEGSAHKLITVRSALLLNNRLNNGMLLKMEHFPGQMNIRNWPKPRTEIVLSNERYAVPLSHVHAYLFVRPLNAPISFDDSNLTQPQLNTDSDSIQKFNGNEYWNKYESINSRSSVSFANSHQFCEKSIHWKDVDDGVDVQQELRTCKSNREKWYRFVAAIKRDGYPTKDAVGVPGHSIYLWPPLRLNNLLPCDLLFKLPSGSQGRVASSETANIHDVDLESQLEITLTLDSYPGAGRIIVPIGHIGSVDTNLRLTDIKNRSLNLRATILMVKGNGMQISVSAPYWLVNRTGLPLVFRQEGVSHESSGQFIENEQARLVSPLMYSIADPDASPALTMRLGKRFCQTTPPWCQPFNLHKDIINRQLKSATSTETFIIGIEVRRGRGRYCKTSVVTFSPRFQLYNRSSFKLQFAQKYFATTLVSSVDCLLVFALSFTFFLFCS